MINVLLIQAMSASRILGRDDRLPGRACEGAVGDEQKAVVGAVRRYGSDGDRVSGLAAAREKRRECSLPEAGWQEDRSPVGRPRGIVT